MKREKSAVVIADEWDWNDLVIWSLGRLRNGGHRYLGVPFPHIGILLDRKRSVAALTPVGPAITDGKVLLFAMQNHLRGPLGLMQLMPATTAKLTAKRYKVVITDIK